MSNTEKFFEVTAPLLEAIGKMFERDPESLQRFMAGVAQGEVIVDCPELEIVARRLSEIQAKAEESGLFSEGVLEEVLQKQVDELTPTDLDFLGRQNIEQIAKRVEDQASNRDGQPETRKLEN